MWHVEDNFTVLLIFCANSFLQNLFWGCCTVLGLSSVLQCDDGHQCYESEEDQDQIILTNYSKQLCNVVAKCIAPSIDFFLCKRLYSFHYICLLVHVFACVHCSRHMAMFIYSRVNNDKNSH